MHTPGWPQFLASHLSPRMKAARAIGRGQGMLTTKNLNFWHDYAQATGDHQHLCALFNAQLAAQEKSDAGFPNAPEGRALPRGVQEFREKETRLLTGERLGGASAARVHLPTAGWQLPGVQASPCPVGSS
ncbi:hypothetical protein TcYC6_0101890 [Trypanosoma cruzi]|nr:hypothetical protein TcYC6_0101890 [Trypanosoma cruzi]